jgi:hypothetical protein
LLVSRLSRIQFHLGSNTQDKTNRHVLPEQQIFPPTETLFIVSFACHRRFRESIAKLSSSMDLIKIPYQNTSKAKSLRIVCTAKKNFSRLVTRKNVTSIKKLF